MEREHWTTGKTLEFQFQLREGVPVPISSRSLSLQLREGVPVPVSLKNSQTKSGRSGGLVSEFPKLGLGSGRADDGVMP